MENLKLIRKIAWSFHYTTGLDLEDLFSEASLAYCEAMERYDPKKAKLSTFMWNHITNHLRNYIEHTNRTAPENISIDDVKITKEVYLSLFFEFLSKEAQTIADIVLSDETSYIGSDPIIAKSRITKVLLKDGWPMHKIWIGMRDLYLAYK